MPIGYLLIDHGSRRAESNRQLEAMADLVRARRPGVPVVTAHMEVAPPTIADGVAALAATGVTEIRPLLYFLADGRHVSEDIPRLLAEAVQGHPQLRTAPGTALGPHELLADLLLSRAGESQAQAPR